MLISLAPNSAGGAVGGLWFVDAVKCVFVRVGNARKMGRISEFEFGFLRYAGRPDLSKCAGG